MALAPLPAAECLDYPAVYFLAGAGFRRQFHHRFAQLLSIADALRKRQAQRRVAAREVEAVRVDPGNPPATGSAFAARSLARSLAVVSAAEFGGIELHSVGVILIHMRDCALFGRDQIFRA